MESPARRRLARTAPALVLAIPLLVIAVLLAASNSGAQLPGPTMITSSNLKFVKNLAESSDGVGARVVGNRLFVTTTKDLVVYDVSDAPNPKRLGSINANIEFENEEVPTNGRILGISGQFGGCTPAGITAPPPAANGCLVIYDVSKAEAPKVLSVVPSAGDHTHTCILDCTYFYGSSGTIVDATDPANAKVLRKGPGNTGAKMNWHEGFGTLDQSCHHQNEIRRGIIAAACQPIFVVSVNPEDGGSVTAPKILAKYRHEPSGREDPPYYSNGPGTGPIRRFIHGVRWPNAGADKFALVGGETNFQATCNDRVGAFMIMDTTQPSPQGSWTQTDEIRPSNGDYIDGSGNGRNQILGCSAHWFEEHPTFKNGGVVALAEYEQGTRVLQITPEGKIRQLAYALPLAGSTSAPHWGPDGRTIYAIDYTRGLDVLQYTGPLVVPDANGAVERPPEQLAPGETSRDSAAPVAAKKASAACGPGTGFRSVSIKGSKVRVARRQQRPFALSLFQQSTGSRVLPNRLAQRVRRTSKASVTLGARDLRGRRLSDGVYLLRATMDLPGVDDVRRIVLRRSGGRWTRRPNAYLRDTCGPLSAFKLDRAVFGGATKRPLRVSYRLPSGVDRVQLEVLHGTKVVRTLKAGANGRGYRFTVPASVARRGDDVRVRITVRRAGATVVQTLVARRL